MTKKKPEIESVYASRSGSVVTSGEGVYIQVDFETKSDMGPLALGLFNRLLRERIYECVQAAVNAEYEGYNQ